MTFEKDDASENQQGGFKKFIAQNKFLIFGGSIVIILLVVLASIYFSLGILGQTKTHETISLKDTEGIQQVEVLPQLQRATETASSSDPQSEKPLDPFNGPITLKGIVMNSNGNSVAVIEASGNSYVVAANDTISNTWKVESISANQVVLKYGDRDYTLTLPDGKKSK